MAARLKSELRPYDLAGRYGGEEFLLVLPACGLGPAIHRAEQIRLSVANDPVATMFGTIPTTVSIGVTVSAPESEFGLEELLRQADQALYRAKAKGRNRAAAFSAEAQSAAGT